MGDTGNTADATIPGPRAGKSPTRRTGSRTKHSSSLPEIDSPAPASGVDGDTEEALVEASPSSKMEKEVKRLQGRLQKAEHTLREREASIKTLEVRRSGSGFGPPPRLIFLAVPWRKLHTNPLH
jgi:hypothetical protein